MYAKDTHPGEPAAQIAPPSAENDAPFTGYPESLADPAFFSRDSLPPISRWMCWGGLAIASSIGLVMGLSAITPYSVTVRAGATVRPTGELKQVEAAASGRIIELFISEHQVVEAGDIIAQLDDSQMQTQKKQLETQVKQAQLQRDNLDQQLQRLDLRLQAERDRARQAARSSEAQLHHAHRAHQEQSVTAITSLAAAEADLRAEQANLAAAKLNVQRYNILVKKGAIATLTLEEAKLEVQQREEAIAAIQARLKRLEVALNPSKAEVAIAQESLAQVESEHRAAIAQLQQQKDALIQQQIQSQQQSLQDQQELDQVDRELTQQRITAPVSGTIFQVQLRNIGQSVIPGEAIAHIKLYRK